MARFDGKTVIITGAAVGIGKACAIKFAKEGANVVLVDMDAEGLKAVEALISEYGHGILSFAMDVSDEAKVKEAVSASIEKFGKVEIMVNNAGIWRRHMPFVETDSSLWKRYIDVNLLGTMYFTHEVLPDMIKHGYGRVINVASVAGMYGNIKMADYSATKAAVIAFTKSIAKEVCRDGVTVNAISPGSVADTFDVAGPTDLCHMGRKGTHTENANVIAFLASEEASYVSGENIAVDGVRRLA